MDATEKPDTCGRGQRSLSLFGFLNFGGGRRKIASRARGFETLAAVSPVAEGFIFGVAAAAQADDRASAESEGLAVHIGDLKFSFNADGTIGIDGDFSWHLYKC